MMESYQVSVKITGLVQGVSYRYYTLREARSLGINGWVRNNSDGSVSVVAEGLKQSLECFITFLKNGSPAAKVKSIDANWSQALGDFSDFEIRWI